MMQNLINNLLGTVSKNKIKETFYKYEIDVSYKDITKISSSLNKENYTHLDNRLKKLKYKWNLIIAELSYSASQDNYTTLILDEIDDTENISIKFEIFKTKENILIINNSVFNKYLESLTLESLLKIINSFNTQFILDNLEDDFEININKKSENKFDLSKQCSFRNSDTYIFPPEVFYFNNIDKNTKSILDDYFLKLTLIYSLVYLSDSSEIKDDYLSIIISGSKTFKYNLSFKELEIKNLKYYYQIYKWVYAEKNKIEDKFGISKNILTSYLKENSIDIEESVFKSILSANQIYVKGNIDKYFEVRNKITEQIEQTIKGVNTTITSFISNFQKSSLVFISYFLSVFIFKVINKSSLDNIFTVETSILGVGFIIVSFLFLIASLVILYFNKRRLKKRYNNVKDRFKDVLITEDINKILNEDFEYNDEIQYLNKTVFTYSSIWVLSIVTFISVLFLTSDYLKSFL